MSRFYVGQRVRIKWCRNPQRFGDLSGLVGTVTGHETYWHKDGSPETCSNVLIDGLPERRSDGNRHGFADDQLEPATDSYDVTTWDTCVWKPEHLRVEA